MEKAIGAGSFRLREICPRRVESTHPAGVGRQKISDFQGIWFGTTHAVKEYEPLIVMMPVKIQCGCGQRYAFDIEPVRGRMPGHVVCPICGSDGTSAANEVIAFTLATEISVKDDGRNMVMALAVVGCLAAGMAGVVKALTMTGGGDVLLCLLGAIGAFGTALCVYFWKQPDS